MESVFILIHMSLVLSHLLSNSIGQSIHCGIALKTRSHDVNFVVIGGTVGCHCDDMG